jgi:hypothetical protein
MEAIPTYPPSSALEDHHTSDEAMAKSRRRFRMIAVDRGIVRIEKRCGFCQRKHVVEFPRDDLGVPRRMNSFCDRCEVELETFLKSHPILRPRRGR